MDSPADEYSDHEETRPEAEEEEEEIDMADLFGEEGGEETALDITVPALPGPAPDSTIYYVKKPSMLALEARPYTALAVRDEYEADRAEADKNAIRWRREGDKTESNARLVRWSNGSLQLYVGDVVYDVHEQPHPGAQHLFVQLSSTTVLCHARLSHRLALAAHSASLYRMRAPERKKEERRTKLTNKNWMDNSAEALRRQQLRVKAKRVRAAEGEAEDYGRGAKRRRVGEGEDEAELASRLNRARSGGGGVTRHRIDARSFLEKDVEEEEEEEEEEEGSEYEEAAEGFELDDE